MNELFYRNLKVGTKLFGRFELVRCLSATDNSGVYLCHDHESDQAEVAIKIVTTKYIKDGKVTERFCDEIRASARVRHPNVVASHAFFQDDEFTAFTMDYIPGGTLGHRIEQHEAFSIDEIVEILLQLASGLREIHAAGIIHRDLKPDNILVGSDGFYKITDFGIASLEGREFDGGPNSMVGTMNYLSPEYVESGRYDERSDIYALGVIAYELLTKRLPFEGGSFFDSLTMRVKHDPKPPHYLRLDCPRDLSRVVTKAIRRLPSERYESAAELMADLNRLGYSSKRGVEQPELDTEFEFGFNPSRMLAY